MSPRKLLDGSRFQEDHHSSQATWLERSACLKVAGHVTCFYQQNTTKVRNSCFAVSSASWLWESKQMSWRSLYGREFWAASVLKGSPSWSELLGNESRSRPFLRQAFRWYPSPGQLPWCSIAEKPGRQQANSRNSKITDVLFQAAKNLLHYFNMLIDVDITTGMTQTLLFKISIH